MATESWIQTILLLQHLKQYVNKNTLEKLCLLVHCFSQIHLITIHWYYNKKYWIKNSSNVKCLQSDCSPASLFARWGFSAASSTWLHTDLPGPAAPHVWKQWILMKNKRGKSRIHLLHLLLSTHARVIHVHGRSRTCNCPISLCVHCATKSLKHLECILWASQSAL